MSSKWRTVPRRRGKGDEADGLGNRKQRIEELKCEGDSSDLWAEHDPRSADQNDAGGDDEAGEDDGDGDGDGNATQGRGRMSKAASSELGSHKLEGGNKLNNDDNSGSRSSGLDTFKLCSM